MSKTSTFFLVLTSLLIGSSLSLIFAPLLSSLLPFSLFSLDIPGMSKDLIDKKTFDLLDFFLTFFFSLIIFISNLWLLKNRARHSFLTIALGLLTFSSFIVFLQTRFINYSKTNTLILILLLFALFHLIVRFKRLFPISFSDLIAAAQKNYGLNFYNGFFLGFFLLLLNNRSGMAFPLISLLIFFITPIVFLAISSLIPAKFNKFPGFLIPIALFFPTDTFKLSFLGLLIIVGWVALLTLKKNITGKILLRFVYPALLVTLIAYNPGFFIGKVDSVEEGFFLSWIERLNYGQVLYKDVAVYHTPLIVWGMYLFSKILGFTIYNERLFLHLLQISGFVVYLFFVKKFIKNPVNIALTLLAFIALASTSIVRNNVEIRLGIGLLGLLFLFNFLSSSKKYWLMLAGAGAGIGLLTSPEVGISVLVTTIVFLNIFTKPASFGKDRLTLNLFYLGGLATILVPFMLYLIITNSLNPFFDQILFYADAFSKGYFNSPIERTVVLDFFHWHILNQYVSSNAFLWEFAKLIVFGSLIYLASKFLVNRSGFSDRDRNLLISLLFGLILFRGALGRSDFYHLLFILPLVVVFLMFFLEKLQSVNKAIYLTLVVVLLFYALRPQINAVFLEDQLFKYQTYGNPKGGYGAFTFPRGKGILTPAPEEVIPLNSLAKDIQTQTSLSDFIFAYPWMPELYFYTQRKNATSFDTPYAFFGEKYQRQMIEELRRNRPKFIIYNPDMRFGGMSPDSLKLVDKYIKENYTFFSSQGQNQILKPN